MIYVGIDVSKDKHDCYIVNSGRENLADAFTVENNLEGFDLLFQQSVSRLVTILFPELENLVPTLHIASVYALLAELPGANQVASCHLTHLTNLLSTASKGHYDRAKAIELRNAARRLHWLRHARQISRTSAYHPPHP